MSSLSTIIVRIKKGDIGKTMQFDPKVTNEREWDEMGLNGYDGQDKTEPFKLSHEYIAITCNYDGYIDGVGAELVTNFSDYDKALNLILGGDCSSIYNGNVKRYAKRGESWEDVQPFNGTKKDNSIIVCPLVNTFLYDYEVGEWQVREVGEKEFRKFSSEVNY